MTLFFWLMALVFVLILAGHIRAEIGYRRMVSEWREQEPQPELDVQIPVRVRPRLYDWEQNGDL